MFREAYPIFLLQRGGLLGLGSFEPAGTESRGGGHGIRPVVVPFLQPPLAIASRQVPGPDGWLELEQHLVKMTPEIGSDIDTYRSASASSISPGCPDSTQMEDRACGSSVLGK
jgi:hypothetical protein